MKFEIVIIIAALGLAQFAGAQVGLGTISGYVYETLDSTKIIPLSRMWVETESGNRYSQSNLDGRYKFDALKPGIYNLYVAPKNYDTTLAKGVVVSSDGITTVDVHCTNNNELDVVVIDFNRVKIEKDIIRIKILSEDIEHSLNIRDPKALG